MPKFLMSAFILFVMIIIFFLLRDDTNTTIKYFPFDDFVTFLEADTKLTLEEDENVSWNVFSVTNEPTYLRQDISLLYENGKFKGVLSSWKQNVDQLYQQLQFPLLESALLDAISFHHAEVHHPDDRITSVQKTTNNRLFLIKEGNSNLLSFHEPTNKKELRMKVKYTKQTNQQLRLYWDRLLSHFHINKDNYFFIPLSELYLYEYDALPNSTRDETAEILGKLWEGLYKNYVIVLNENENIDNEHYMPLILFANDRTHLLVIFELDGEKQKLIQKIPK